IPHPKGHLGPGRYLPRIACGYHPHLRASLQHPGPSLPSGGRRADQALRELPAHDQHCLRQRDGRR
ncbi:hypothetical protein BN1708_020680, partial [Verticillium longisporum]